MAVRHIDLPIHGVQFHPESILTEGGHRMLANWLGYCGEGSTGVAGPPAGTGSRRHRPARHGGLVPLMVVLLIAADAA